MSLDYICIYRYTHVHAYIEKFIFLHIQGFELLPGNVM